MQSLSAGRTKECTSFKEQIKGSKILQITVAKTQQDWQLYTFIAQLYVSFLHVILTMISYMSN